MKILHVTIFTLAVALVLLPVTTFSENEVDLRGKEGIIDPQDLKKHDPKKRPIEIKELPPPSPPPDVPINEIDRGGIDD